AWRPSGLAGCRARTGDAMRARWLAGSALRRLALPAVAALAAAATVSCGDISSPQRCGVYEWRLFVGDNPISFHWPENRLPVRIWVQDEYDMPAHVRAAADQWRA